MLPPTVITAQESIHTTSYYSKIPECLLNQTHEDNLNDPIILGVDEAGRGPVLGPMVYGIAFCKQSYQDNHIIPNYSFDDSKKLTDPIRRQLFAKIYETDNDELNEIGYAATMLSALDISSGMQKFPPSKQYNLNEQAHDTTIDLIDNVIKKGVNVSHVFVDTVGPPESYQQKLSKRFPQIKFTVEKKADAKYCMVSVASVVAKVTRDLLVETMVERYNSTVDDKHKITNTEVGSGYPSDPRTKKWLQDEMKPFTGWPQEIVRFSWQTAKTLLENNDDTVKIKWEEDFINTSKTWQRKWEMEWNQRQAVPWEDEPPITLDNWY